MAIYSLSKVPIGDKDTFYFFSKEVIAIQHYETTDIFIGAFFLSKGGDLCGIRIKDAVRGIAAFEIRRLWVRRLWVRLDLWVFWTTRVPISQA